MSVEYSKEALEEALKLVIAAIVESEGVYPSFYIWADLVKTSESVECLKHYEKEAGYETY